MTEQPLPKITAVDLFLIGADSPLRVVGEPVGEWLAVTPALVGWPHDPELTGRWTVSHRGTGRNACQGFSRGSIDAARQYARDADALGAEVWTRDDLADGWLTTVDAEPFRRLLKAAIYRADLPDAPGHSQSESAQPAEAA